MSRPTRTYATLLTVGLCTGAAAALASMQANAQSENLLDISATLPLDADISASIIPLSNSFQPTTPWPMPTGISQTMLQPSHDLLAYVGVESAARQLLGADYPTWRAHFSGKTETTVLSNGLLTASGCLQPECTMHKSLLVVSPATQKVYTAMVTEGRVAMWPSLMSWPDAAVPALKDWLADATPAND